MVTLTISLAGGQVSSFQVAIPFPFVVRNQTLPAGTYVVQRPLGKPKSAVDVGVIVIKGGDHHVYKVIMTASGKESRAVGAAGSQLIFTSFKGREYLNRVCVAGDAVVRQLANVPPEVAAQGAGGEVIVTSLHNGKGKVTNLSGEDAPMKPSVGRIRGNLHSIVAALALFSLAALTQAHAARKAHSASSDQPDLSLGGGLTVVAQTPPIQIGGEYHIRATASLQIAAADVGVFCFVTTTNHGFAQDHLLSDWTAAGELEEATISESWPVGDGEAIQLVCYSGDSDSLVRNASLTAVPVRSSRNSARTSAASSNHARAAN